MYCPNCSQYIDEYDLEFSLSSGSDFSLDEDCMSTDDEYPYPTSPKKRTRSEAKLSNSDDNDRPRKRFSPLPSIDVIDVDAMQVDHPDFTLSNKNKF